MKAIFYFLVEVLDDYNNYETLENGLEIMTNNTIESVEHINRVGKVISSPRGTIANKGDSLLFHHNICRKERGFKGKKPISPFQVKPNIYFIPFTEVFMIDKGDGWQAIEPFVFVEPVPPTMVTLENGLKIPETEYKGYNESIGKVSYSNPWLIKRGVDKGSIVAFEEFSQHEYEIDGKLHYRMQAKDILGVY